MCKCDGRMSGTCRGSDVYNNPTTAAGNIQQHFPSVYLCAYNIVSLLWACHGCFANIYLLTHTFLGSFFSVNLFWVILVFINLLFLLTLHSSYVSANPVFCSILYSLSVLHNLVLLLFCRNHRCLWLHWHKKHSVFSVIGHYFQFCSVVSSHPYCAWLAELHTTPHKHSQAGLTTRSDWLASSSFSFPLHPGTMACVMLNGYWTEEALQTYKHSLTWSTWFSWNSSWIRPLERPGE